MPTISAPAKVLVTGANGFIALWVVRTLLEEGYSVRGAVRSRSKAEYIEKYFKDYGDKIETVVVEDMTKESAFDEAVKGMDAIEHTASPIGVDAEDPEEIIRPAVQGTVGVLKSALKRAPNVKRIVVTASLASMTMAQPTSHIFTEDDWNDEAIEIVERDGRAAPNIVKYRASKTLAEKAAWNFVEQHKSEIGWDLTVIHPPWVLGPPIHDVASPETANVSVRAMFNALVRETTPEQLKYSSAWVDVRDLASAHVKALQLPAAGGQRIIVSAGHYFWQDWLDVANSLSPPPLGSYRLPKGSPGSTRDTPPAFAFDTTKAARVLDIKYRSKEECARDALEEFVRRGWVP